MDFKNIAKVSEHNFRVYKANFQYDVSIGQKEQAKQKYALIFTKEEMDFLIMEA